MRSNLVRAKPLWVGSSRLYKKAENEEQFSKGHFSMSFNLVPASMFLSRAPAVVFFYGELQQ